MRYATQNMQCPRELSHQQEVPPAGTSTGICRCDRSIRLTRTRFRPWGSDARLPQQVPIPVGHYVPLLEFDPLGLLLLNHAVPAGHYAALPKAHFATLRPKKKSSGVPITGMNARSSTLTNINNRLFAQLPSCQRLPAPDRSNSPPQTEAASF
jgi:hypothetical protein